ncbi:MULTISPECIES: hypothetical protein [Deinococcus]|uniref:ABC transporter permease n=1 Tax=Deinococcus rufus TaxID=2136097 RepID=A0ABV7Z2N1_9DEIO|nr:hypothetical protein [Deinococcus sp. AB2017081]WQE95916.1 hypothetical protein U2P90_03240 [Deinococcus sp. AB2017081]
MTAPLMTSSARHFTPDRAIRPAPRRAGSVGLGVLMVVLLPAVLVASALAPRQVRELADASDID